MFPFEIASIPLTDQLKSSLNNTKIILQFQEDVDEESEAKNMVVVKSSSTAQEEPESYDDVSNRW